MIWSQETNTTRVDCHGLTDAGHERTTNSDACLVTSLTPGSFGERHEWGGDATREALQLLMVADGIGRTSGRQASALAVDVVSRYLHEQLDEFDHRHYDAGRQLMEILESAVLACQARIQARAAAGLLPSDTGTTATLACIAWPRLCLTHVGDGRAYLYRDGRLKRLTTDHTFAQRLVDAGILEADRIAGSQWKHVLWNVVGGNLPDLELESRELRLTPDDVLLLCTDGLPNSVSDAELVRLLGRDRTAEETCRDLIDAALCAGGRDNVTAVVARFQRQEP